MSQTMLPQTLERFTIEVAPGGEGAVLSLAWDDRRFSIPFRTRQ
jgi:hypothetical protein